MDRGGSGVVVVGIAFPPRFEGIEVKGEMRRLSRGGERTRGDRERERERDNKTNKDPNNRTGSPTSLPGEEWPRGFTYLSV